MTICGDEYTRRNHHLRGRGVLYGADTNLREAQNPEPTGQVFAHCFVGITGFVTILNTF
jgi:hypothetical protein